MDVGAVLSKGACCPTSSLRCSHRGAWYLLAPRRPRRRPNDAQPAVLGTCLQKHQGLFSGALPCCAHSAAAFDPSMASCRGGWYLLASPRPRYRPNCRPVPISRSPWLSKAPVFAARVMLWRPWLFVLLVLLVLLVVLLCRSIFPLASEMS
jgi:hypothetical protein